MAIRFTKYLFMLPVLASDTHSTESAVTKISLSSIEGMYVCVFICTYMKDQKCRYFVSLLSVSLYYLLSLLIFYTH